MTAKDVGPATEIVEQFAGRIMPLGEITYKKMFGGYGVFESGTMFALVTKEGGVYLKSGDTNLTRFEQAGATKHGRMPYYQIPDQVLEDDSQLMEWTQEAIEVSKDAKK
jgi:DNA transformation protein